MQFKYKLLLTTLVLTIFLVGAGGAYATINTNINISNRGLPSYGDKAAAGIVESVFNWFFVVAGALCIAIIIWAGITYATAGGDEEKVEKAKKRLIYGIIGVAVIIAAFAITQLIENALTGSEIPTPNL